MNDSTMDISKGNDSTETNEKSPKKEKFTFRNMIKNFIIFIFSIIHRFFKALFVWPVSFAEKKSETLLEKILIAGGIYIVSIVIIAAMYFPLNQLYRWVNPTQFPTASEEFTQVRYDIPENEKCQILTKAITNRYVQEKNSFFGYVPDDILPTVYLDDISNRQKGTISAMYLLSRFFSTNIAKHGQSDDEHPGLKLTREKYFNYDMTTWGGIVKSTEGRYKLGLKAFKEYNQQLLAGKAVYNMRSDDKYGIIDFIIGSEFIDECKGKLLKENIDVGFFESDDHIYYAQGVMLVVRDVVNTLNSLYPEFSGKGGSENMKIALKALDQICNFDTYIVTNGGLYDMRANHRKNIASQIQVVKDRLQDISSSLKA